MLSKQHNQSINISSEIWAQKVWRNAEQKWIARDGQDCFYRDYVAIPGLLFSIKQLCTISSIDIVDIGSGDGYFTNGLISEITNRGFELTNIYLLDLSKEQLNISTNRTFLNSANKLVCNFLDPDWPESIPNSNKRRLFISVFVIQELPSLDAFLNGLSRVMKSDDIAFFLTVDPSFSALLARKNIILSITNGNSSNNWDWRGLYPIDGDAGRFYLPHFQRKIGHLTKQFAQNGLQCIYRKFLKIPLNKQTISIFSKTIYGTDILGTKSSVILAIKKVNSNGRKSNAEAK